MEFLKKYGWFLMGVASFALAIYIDVKFLAGSDGITSALLATYALLLMLKQPGSALAGKALILMAALFLCFRTLALQPVDEFLKEHGGLSSTAVYWLLLAPFGIWMLWALTKESVNELRGKGEPGQREPE
jgi:hypothetical protein